MSKTDYGLTPRQTTILFLFGIVVFGLIGGNFAQDLNKSLDYDDTVIVDSVNGLLFFESKQGTVNETILQALEKQAFLTAELRNETKALRDYDQTITQNIASINKRLANTPTGSDKDPQDESPSGAGSIPSLTISLTADKFHRGEIVWINGSTGPRDRVESSILDPTGRIHTPTQNADKNGQFTIAWFNDLNDPLGFYKVFVESNNQKSEVLSFELIE